MSTSTASSTGTTSTSPSSRSSTSTSPSAPAGAKKDDAHGRGKHRRKPPRGSSTGHGHEHEHGHERRHKRTQQQRLPTSMLPVVALVGRPNVGKSALFNRLVRKRVAIVHDTPLGHVTRDYQEGRAVLGDVEFLAVDTSGLEVVMRDGIGAGGTLASTTRARSSTVSKNTESINMRATRLTEGILRQSDVVLFLLDGKDGVTAVDRDGSRSARDGTRGSR